MGLYINPTDESKESWLTAHAERIDEAPSWDEISEGSSAVCLVNNGMFTAAGVCYSARELEEFSKPDGRPKVWFIAKDSKLNEVTDGGLAEWKSKG